MENTSSILTVKEVADILRCSKAHVHNAIHGKVHGLPILTHLTMGRRNRPHNGRGLPRLLDLLRRSGVLPRVVALKRAGHGQLQEFDLYLERVRGAARATRIVYLREARHFIKHVFGDSDPHWTEIGPEHVASYITLRAAQMSVSCRRNPLTPMRAFLRYMTGVGLLSAHLEFAIPPVRQWKQAALPAALSPDELGKVLAVPCERTVKSLRNRAILLLLARLGLRAGEVLRLHLEDVDWRRAKLLVRAGKNHHERVLPLPEDVGQALISYLKNGRPSADRRAMFLNLCYPYRSIGSSQTVGKIALQALRQAGVSTTHPGAHIFRRTVATHMVCGGATFKSVADVLGHRTLSVIGIYAKLDLASLAKVALPWPGGAQ